MASRWPACHPWLAGQRPSPEDCVLHTSFRWQCALDLTALPSDALYMVPSKRRQPDVDGLSSRLEAARLANISPLKGGLDSAEELAQPLKRPHLIFSPG